MLCRDTPILFLAAAGTFEEQRSQMAADHNTDYLIKPFSPSEVAEHVDAMLDPAKRDAFGKERGLKEARLSRIVEIMHRPKE